MFVCRSNIFRCRNVIQHSSWLRMGGEYRARLNVCYLLTILQNSLEMLEAFLAKHIMEEKVKI